MNYSEQTEAVSCDSNEEGCHHFDEWITPEGIAVVSMYRTDRRTEQHPEVNQLPMKSPNFVKES